MSLVKYVPSAFVGRLSRSAGSTTAAHNRFGAYLRNRVVPTNRMTASQTAQRANLALFSAGWKALTAIQKAGWTALGLNMTRTDSLGSTYNLTGQLAYISINRNLSTIAAAAVTSPPAYVLPAPLTSVTITATSV